MTDPKKLPTPDSPAAPAPEDDGMDDLRAHYASIIVVDADLNPTELPPPKESEELDD